MLESHFIENLKVSKQNSCCIYNVLHYSS